VKPRLEQWAKYGVLTPRKGCVSPFLVSQVGFAIPEKNGISFDITTFKLAFGITDI